MNWYYVGWGVIGITAVLLIIFTVKFKRKGGYILRHYPAVEGLRNATTTALERGLSNDVVLGDAFWSYSFPGLGLHSLSVLPHLLTQEAYASGGLSVSGADGSLVLFAQQIVHQQYADGFSTALAAPTVRPALHGPTPSSFTAGLLPQIRLRSVGALALFGNYGAEGLLWAEAVASRGGHVFAGAGALTAQAALFSTVDDLLMGEEIFILPGVLSKTVEDQAGWLVEDIVRTGLMVLLIIGAILMALGVL